MAAYIEKNSLTLLTGASDPEGDAITVHRIDGAIPSSWPHVVALDIGSASITQDGVVTYDDGGATELHPLLGATTSAGSFSFTLWDGHNESPSYTSTITLNGIDIGAVPLSAFMHLGDPIDETNFTLSGNEISQWNDLTGNGNHATQPDNTKRPVRRIDGNQSWCAQQSGDQHMILNGLPTNIPFHLAIGFSTSDGIGTLLHATTVNRPFAVQWHHPGSPAPIQPNLENATFESIQIAGNTFTNNNTKSELGLQMLDASVILVKNLVLNTSTGYIWDAARLFHHEDSDQFSVDANIYGVIAFTDWNETTAAEAYLSQIVGANIPPLDIGEDLEFNVGSAQ